MKSAGKLVTSILVMSLVVVSLWYGWYRYVTSTFPDTAKITDDQVKVLAARGQFFSRHRQVHGSAVCGCAG